MWYMEGEVGGGVGDDHLANLGHLGTTLGDHTWWPHLVTTLGDHTRGPNLGTTLGTTLGDHIRGPHSGTTFGDHIRGTHLGDTPGTILGGHTWDHTRGPGDHDRGPYLGTTLGDNIWGPLLIALFLKLCMVYIMKYLLMLWRTFWRHNVPLMYFLIL